MTSRKAKKQPCHVHDTAVVYSQGRDHHPSKIYPVGLSVQNQITSRINRLLRSSTALVAARQGKGG